MIYFFSFIIIVLDFHFFFHFNLIYTWLLSSIIVLLYLVKKKIKSSFLDFFLYLDVIRKTSQQKLFFNSIKK